MRHLGASRPALRAWAAGSALMVVLALAASSGPIELWITPSTERTATSIESAPAQIEQTPDRDSIGSVSTPLVGSILTVIGSVILVVVVGSSLLLTRELGSWMWMVKRSERTSSARQRTSLVMPVPRPKPLRVDAEAALTMLTHGTPRNAIVGCWMQLERDAAAVGLPRLVAETPAEYVRRVAYSASVNPAPIDELAELYREARFSRHELTNGHRTRAASALRGVVDELDAHREVSS